MRILQLSWIIVAVVCFTSCNKNNTSIDPLASLGNIIRFDELEIGQTSKYIFFIGSDYTDLTKSNFLYYTDTLVVEIVDIDANGYLVKEYLTDNSASKTGASNVPFPDAEFSYYINVDGETAEPTLKVDSQDSRLKTRLFQFSSQTTTSFALEDNEDMEIDIIAWSTSQPLFDGILEAYTKDLEILEQVFPRLNVFIDNRDIPFGAPGTANIYHKRYGLVRSVQYNAANGKGFGWDLLP